MKFLRYLIIIIDMELIKNDLFIFCYLVFNFNVNSAIRIALDRVIDKKEESRHRCW
jgi:hypothetical protein